MENKSSPPQLADSDFASAPKRVGLICDSVPHVLERRGKDFFACVSQISQLCVFNLDKIRRVFISPTLPGAIDAVCMCGSISGAAVGKRLFIFQTHRLVGSDDVFPSSVICRAERDGATVFLCRSGEIVVADLRRTPVYVSKPISLVEANSQALPTSVAVLPFPNKEKPGRFILPRVIVGYSDGTVRIWRLETKSLTAHLLHKLKCTEKALSALAKQKHQAGDGRTGFTSTRGETTAAIQSTMTARSSLLEGSDDSQDNMLDEDMEEVKETKVGTLCCITALLAVGQQKSKDVPEMCTCIGTSDGTIFIVDAKKDTIMKTVKVTERDSAIRSICLHCDGDRPPVLVCTHDIPSAGGKANATCYKHCTMMSVINVFSGEVSNHRLGHRGLSTVSLLEGETIFFLQQRGMLALVKGDNINAPGITRTATAPPSLSAVLMRFTPSHIVYSQAKNSARVATSNGIARALADGLDVFAIGRAGQCRAPHFKFPSLSGLPEWYVKEGERATSYSLWTIDTIDGRRTKRLGDVAEITSDGARTRFHIEYNTTSNTAEDTLVTSHVYGDGSLIGVSGQVEVSLFDTHLTKTKHELFSSPTGKGDVIPNGMHCGQFSVLADNSKKNPVLRAFTYAGNSLWDVKLPYVPNNEDNKIVGLFRGCPVAAKRILARGESVVSVLDRSGFVYSKILLGTPDSLVHDSDTRGFGVVRLGDISGKLSACCLVSSFLTVGGDDGVVYVYDLGSVPTANKGESSSDDTGKSKKTTILTIPPIHKIPLSINGPNTRVTQLESFAGVGLGLLLAHISSVTHIIDTLGGIDLGVLAFGGAIKKNSDPTPSVTAENGVVYADGDSSVLVDVDVARVKSLRGTNVETLTRSSGVGVDGDGVVLSAKGLHAMCTNTIANISSLSDIQKSTTELLHVAGAARSSTGTRVPFLLSLIGENNNENVEEETVEYNDISGLWKAAEKSVDRTTRGESRTATIDNVLDNYETLLAACVAPKYGENTEYDKSDKVFASGLDQLRETLKMLHNADATVVTASNVLGVSPQYF